MTRNERAIRAVMICAGGMVIFRLVETAILFRGLDVVLRLARGEEVDPSSLQSLALWWQRIVVVWMVAGLAYVGSLVAFCVVAHQTLRRAGVTGLRFSPLSVALLWLVPVWNLIHPLIALQELFRASLHEPLKAHLFDWHDEDRSAVISAAWLLAVGSGVFDLTVAMFVSRDPGPDVLVVAFALLILSSAMAYAAVLMYAYAVDKIGKRIHVLESGII